MRERLGSRLGFILLSAGCAIGLGNIWRFPYIMGQSGGAWFVLIYLAFLLLLGVPVLVMEFAAGRAAMRSIATLHKELVPERKLWRAHGVMGFIGNIMLMMFYTTVTGWMLIYFAKAAMGEFADFGSVLGDYKTQLFATMGVCFGASMVCAVGLQKGLERVTKVMMSALFILILLLAANSCLLPGAVAGLKFYLVPNTENLLKTGVLTTMVNAMNQAFFTLSLGIGCMAIFASYIGKERTLLGETINIVVLDTFVALMAGLIIMPACFAYGVSPGQGPGLIFVTLPMIFKNMPLGGFWGALFFLFMSFAALTTVLAVFEMIIACFREYTGLSRRPACAIVAVAITLLSVPCVLGFNLWSGFAPLGAGTNVLDLEDMIVSDILLPLGALLFILFTTARYGWGWKKFIAEANIGLGPKFPEGLRIYCGYILPAIVAIIFVLGLAKRF